MRSWWSPAHSPEMYAGAALSLGVSSPPIKGARNEAVLSVPEMDRHPFSTSQQHHHQLLRRGFLQSIWIASLSCLRRRTAAIRQMNQASLSTSAYQCTLAITRIFGNLRVREYQIWWPHFSTLGVEIHLLRLPSLPLLTSPVSSSSEFSSPTSLNTTELSRVAHLKAYPHSSSSSGLHQEHALSQTFSFCPLLVPTWHAVRLRAHLNV